MCLRLFDFDFDLLTTVECRFCGKLTLPFPLKLFCSHGLENRLFKSLLYPGIKYMEQYLYIVNFVDFDVFSEFETEF